MKKMQSTVKESKLLKLVEKDADEYVIKKRRRV